ncbi:MAG: hypothetical protein KHY83_06725 [Coriobacteriia bacterium]|nr:hypothetical protein [Coriobacteriia bacterium]MBS5478342.1 hypothetical protein [Coriobacteriia bacterium]
MYQITHVDQFNRQVFVQDSKGGYEYQINLRHPNNAGLEEWTGKLEDLVSVSGSYSWTCGEPTDIYVTLKRDCVDEWTRVFRPCGGSNSVEEIQ